MVCNHCGTPLGAGDKFCQNCGAPVSGASQQPPVKPMEEDDFLFGSTPKPKEKPAKKGGKGPGGNKKLLLIGGIAAAVAVVVLLVVLLVTGQPSAKVAAALAASGKELSQISDTLHADTLTELSKKAQLSQDIDFRLDSVEGDNSFNGIGVSMQADISLDKRKVGIAATPYFGAVEICSLMMAAEDDMIYFGLPEILPDPAYGLSTVTMMQDLEAMGADLEELADISFNIFDLIEMVQEEVKIPTEEAQKDVEAAGNALVAALEVEKNGKQSIRVNGKSTKCTVYDVTVPQNELEDLVQAYEDYLNAVDYEEILEMVYEAMGLPSDIIDEVMYEMGSIGGADLEDVYALLDELGDIDLEVCISGGKVSAVKFEGEIYESDLEINLYIGGGENYADDITLELIADGDEITVESTGNHTGKGGVFTDETIITNPNGDTMEIVTEYDTKDDGYLTFKLEVDQDVIEIEGYYQVKGSTVTLNLEECTIIEYGDELLSFSLNYTLMDYEDRVKPEDARLLSSMDQEDIMEIAELTTENAEAWLLDLIAEIPELQYLLY